MSAEKKSWGICPRCKKENKEKILNLQVKAKNSYGKVSPEEYQELLNEANDAINKRFIES